DILACYEPSEVIEILGSKGTIVAVDTSGFHKGKPPVSRDRLIVQIEFTNSFFGQKVRNLNIPKAQQQTGPYQDIYQEVYERLGNKH
ncbi:MAG: hypothetical protein AAFO69_06265, partial [Bacteroidota bacterium]